MVLPIVRKRSAIPDDRIRSWRFRQLQRKWIAWMGFFGLILLHHQFINLESQDYDSKRLQQESILRTRDEPSMERAVFYNIFVPKASPGSAKGGSISGNALDLVKEQLSYVSVAPEFVRSAPIHYTLIGDIHVTTKVEEICNSSLPTSDSKPCRLLQAVEEGDEGLTLDSLYRYCLAHPSSRVTYLHNKGSFHPSPENTSMRRMATKSIFSEECQSMPTDRCNLCSGRFAPLPHLHITANMWTADCSYVKKLIPPLEFADRMDAMVANSIDPPDQRVLPIPTKDYLDRPHDYGLGRFSMEHWVGSHPQLRPCDVYPDPSYAYGFRNLKETSLPTSEGYKDWKPVLRAAPWIPLANFWHWSFNEWFCGQGRLEEYKFLYGMVPENDGFLWSIYSEPLKPPFIHFNSLFDKGCPTPILPPPSDSK